MITLYNYANPTRASRVIWTLHELDMEYDVKVLNPMAGEHRTPEYLAINPAGKVPSLTHNGNSFTESLAIMEYLNDLHPDRPLTPNPADADYAQKNYQMRHAISYGMAELENYVWVMSQATWLKMLYTWPEGTAEECKKRLEKALPRVAGWLEAHDYIAGDEFTLADIYYYQLLGWIQMQKLALPEHVTAYLKRLASREKFPDALKPKK